LLMTGNGFTKEFGKALRKVRLKRGLSQMAVASLAGVDQPQVSYWENGKHPPNFEHLIALIRVFPELVNEIRKLANATEREKSTERV